MNLQKTKPIRSRAYTQAADGQPCVRCGRQDGTVVACHYTGQYQHAYGKGRGIKCHDILAADLCKPCHDFFDGYEHELPKVEASDLFHHYICLTLVRRYRQGVLKL